jgi:hypothetical protein
MIYFLNTRSLRTATTVILAYTLDFPMQAIEQKQ